MINTDDYGSGLTPKTVSMVGTLAAVSAVTLIIVFLVGYDAFRVVNHNKNYDRYLSAGNQELESLRTQERIGLETYGWIDQEKTRVRIPIERAKELLLEEASR